jgi:hypothetical protein
MVEFRGIPPLPQKQKRGKDGAPALYSLAGIASAEAVPYQSQIMNQTRLNARVTVTCD